MITPLFDPWCCTHTQRLVAAALGMLIALFLCTARSQTNVCTMVTARDTTSIAVGRSSMIESPLCRRYRFEYDGDGKLVAMIDDYGNRRELTYKNAGSIVQMTDENNHTSGGKSVVDRLIKQIDPDGKTAVFEYNPAGQLMRKTLQHSVVFGCSVTPTGRGIEFDYTVTDTPRAVAKRPAQTRSSLAETVLCEPESNPCYKSNSLRTVCSSL